MAEVHRKLLYFNKESLYGTAATLEQAIPCRVRDYNPWVANMRQKANVQNHAGAQRANTLDNFFSITIEVDLAGSGTAGTKPLYSALFEACKRSVVDDAEAHDTTVALNDAGTSSGTLGLHVDNFLFKAVGVRGNASFQYQAGAMPMLVCDLWGIPLSPSNTAMPAIPDLTGFLEPVSINNVNSDITIFGYQGVLNSLTLNDGHEIVRRDKPNDKGVYLRNRIGAGSIEFELPGISAKDFFGEIRGDKSGAIEIVIGTVAGNIITHTAPNVQLTNPRLTEVDGALHVSTDIINMPTAGAKDDESTLVFS
ncbi:MAG TPA: hypothetical protein VNR18_09690 [Hyphomicrobiales bacterium]|nr:hypothetical protein [Hyphomicrobiales bacterium]